MQLRRWMDESNALFYSRQYHPFQPCLETWTFISSETIQVNTVVKVSDLLMKSYLKWGNAQLF